MRPDGSPDRYLQNSAALVLARLPVLHPNSAELFWLFLQPIKKPSVILGKCFGITIEPVQP
jgi:hypothetical protein